MIPFPRNSTGSDAVGPAGSESNPPGAAARCALATLLAALVMAGCVSTQDRFDKGVKYEEEGRYEAAAGEYIRVLQDEPNYEGARERLEYVSKIVVERYQLEARDLRATGQMIRSSDVVRSLLSFRSRVESVGVDVAMPDSMYRFRDQIERLAVGKLLDQAELARSEGKWYAAVADYDRALGRGVLVGAEAETVRQSRLEIEVFWAESLLTSGQPRAAWGHAQSALDGGLADGGARQRAIELQAEAVRVGTRPVAVLPIGARESVRREASTELIVDLNDLLMVDHWTRPPLFIAIADPVAVRREFRMLHGRGYDIASKGDALEIGRIVDADWTVVVEVEHFRRLEKELKSELRRATVRGRSGADTSYYVIDTEISIAADVAFRIYDVAARESVYDNGFEVGVKDRIQRGRFAGDYTVLDLSGRELEYFEEEEYDRLVLRLEDDLVRLVADRLGERTFNRILTWIP